MPRPRGRGGQTTGIPASRKTAFFLGGGMAALNALYATAEQQGVHILYDHPVNELRLDDLPARAVIVCCGGHQADLGHGFINRGAPFATGTVLRSLLAQGVAVMGRADAGHLVAVDARSPDHDGGIVTRVDGMGHGMVVDASGRRFQDETAITGQTRYAVWGRLVAEHPERRAALVLDADGILAVPTAIFPPVQAASLARRPPVMSLAEARRAFTLCIVCNYCNGFCEMFRAAERRRTFSDGELTYLAHLCHDCRNCRPACQYAPPHAFAIDVPKTLAELRRDSWRDRPWGALALIVLIPALILALVPWEVLFARHVGPGAFYAVLPWSVLCIVAAIPLLWSVVALGLDSRRFWHDSGGIACDGGTARRWFHHALVLGLLAWRETTAMGFLLAVHLGCVAGFFATLAYGKFAHAPYRAAALLRAAMERQNGP